MNTAIITTQDLQDFYWREKKKRQQQKATGMGRRREGEKEGEREGEERKGVTTSIPF